MAVSKGHLGFIDKTLGFVGIGAALLCGLLIVGVFIEGWYSPGGPVNYTLGFLKEPPFWMVVGTAVVLLWVRSFLRRGKS